MLCLAVVVEERSGREETANENKQNQEVSQIPEEEGRRKVFFAAVQYLNLPVLYEDTYK